MAASIIEQFNTVAITGGSGGIGKRFAEYLIEKKKKVIIIGRTEKNLQKTAKEINAAAYYVLDTGDVSAIPDFVKKITKEHPDLDCIINNAGVQKPLEVQKLDAAEFLEKADQEIDINIRGPLHLTLHLLPHLKSKKSAVVMNVSSALGFIPFSIINPVYNGTKAWLHFFTTNLRTQLKETNIKVVEIAPPMVATDLHRDRENPDDNKKENAPHTMTVDEFMDDVAKGWEQGEETIGGGMSKDIIKRWYDTYGKHYAKADGDYKPS